MSSLRSTSNRTPRKILFTTALIAGLLTSGCSIEKAPSNKDSQMYFSVKTIGPSVNIRALDGQGTLHKLTDDSRWRDLDIDIANNGDLLFVSNRKENFKIDLNKHSDSYNLFLQKKGELEPTKIAAHGKTEISPKFSPNDQWISYLLQEDSHYRFLLMPRSGGEPKSIYTAKEITAYDWSPSGDYIAIAHNDDTTAYISHLEASSGRNKVLLSMPLKAPSQDHKPNDEDNIMKKVGYLNWSPNGEHIAYIRSPTFHGSRQLRVFNLKDQSDQPITTSGIHAQDGVSWTKNGKQLLYAALVGYKFYYDETIHKKVYEGGMHIFQYAVGEKENQQLTSGDHVFKRPTYSPDEKLIAYFYSDTLDERTYHLSTMNRKGNERETLQESVTPSSSLLWK